MDKFKKDMLLDVNGVSCRVLDIQYDEFLEESYCVLYLHKIEENTNMVIIGNNQNTEYISIIKES